MSIETLTVFVIAAGVASAVYLVRRSRNAAAKKFGRRPDEQVERIDDENTNVQKGDSADQNLTTPSFEDKSSHDRSNVDVVEEIKSAIGGIRSSFEHLDEVIKTSQNEVVESSVDKSTVGVAASDSSTANPPDSATKKKKPNQKAQNRTVDKSRSSARHPRKRLHRPTRVQIATGEAMQAIEALFVAFEDLADDESGRQIIRKEKTNVLDTYREKSPEETFSACRRAFLAVNNAFTNRDDSEVNVAITEVLTAIDNTVQAVEAAFRVIDNGTQSSVRILEAISEATSVIRAATRKIRQIIEVESSGGPTQVLAAGSFRDADTSQRDTDAFQTQKVTVEREKPLTREDVQATFRTSFPKSRQYIHIEINDKAVKRIDEFLARIESKIEDEMQPVKAEDSVAALKNEIDRYREKLVSSVGRKEESAINEIAEQCKRRILSPSSNLEAVHAVVIGKICMMATKSILVKEIVDAVVYSYEGKDVQEVKEACTFLVMRYIKDVAETRLNSSIN